MLDIPDRVHKNDRRINPPNDTPTVMIPINSSLMVNQSLCLNCKKTNSIP